MTPGEMILAAKRQQDRTGKKDAAVSFVIPGKWPDNGDRKRLAGRKGPLGQCMAEYEDAVLCLFKADEVITFAAKLLPTVSFRRAPSAAPSPTAPTPSPPPSGQDSTGSPA